MSGTIFGKEVKRLRMLAGISTRELSKQVGKASAYVSQLEGGRIRNPDYNTCCDLLKVLGVKEDQIDIILEYCGIESPLLLEQQIEATQRRSEEEEEKYRTHFYERRVERMKRDVNFISNALLDLIELGDVHAADRVVTNLRLLTEEEDAFIFFCKLLSHDLSRISHEGQRKVMRTIEACTADPNFVEEVDED